MKIGVGAAAYVTTRAHVELARSTLESITSDEHELAFCFFLNAPVPAETQQLLESYGHVHANDENNVSRAWNRAIACLLDQGCDYVLVPNLDIVMKQGSLDALVRHAEANPTPLLWTMANWHYLHRDGVNPGIDEAPLHDNAVPHPHFSCFMVDERLFEIVGPFDEAIKPAYNEDLDMHWRIRLAGCEAVQYEGARFYHHGSGTIRNDPELNERNHGTHSENNAYFVRKWGYKPPTADDPFTKDMFRYPFNDPTRQGFERGYRSTW